MQEEARTDLSQFQDSGNCGKPAGLVPLEEFETGMSRLPRCVKTRRGISTSVGNHCGKVFCRSSSVKTRTDQRVARGSPRSVAGHARCETVASQDLVLKGQSASNVAEDAASIRRCSSRSSSSRVAVGFGSSCTRSSQVNPGSAGPSRGGGASGQHPPFA